MEQIPHPLLTRPQPAGGVYAGLATPEASLEAGRFYLLIAPRPAVDRLMDALAVRLALAIAGRPGADTRQPYLHILDGGNRFDLHAIARGLAGKPPAGSLGVEAILRRIRVARAFTCYQMEALLAGAAECGGGSELSEANGPGAPSPAPTTGAGLPAPVLAPGLLTTFADENVRPGERLRLLQRCLQELKRLAQRAPVLVSVTSPSASSGALEFLPRLEAAADQVWRFEAGAGGRSRPTALSQLHLF